MVPVISRERVPRRAIEDDGTIAVMGSLDQLATVGRAGGPAKRPVVMGIYRTYRMAVHAEQPNMPVYVTLERPLRVRRWAWRGNRAVELEPAVSVRESNAGVRGAATAHRRQPRRQTRSERRGGRAHG